MGMDHTTIFGTILEHARSDRPISECMDIIISVCSGMVPHRAWDGMRVIDFEADVSNLRGWIRNAIEGDPPPTPVQGLWFGLFNPVENGRVSADMYFAGTSAYDPRDDTLQWTGSG